MPNWPRSIVSRRAALAGLAATAYGAARNGAAIAETLQDGAAENGGGPVFSPSGPDAKLYGAEEGFPIADRALLVQPGNPYEPKYRVGAFSHFDEIYPARRIKRAAAPWLRQFAMVGALGQRICVDPASKLVMVQAAVDDHSESWRLWSALVEQFGQG